MEFVDINVMLSVNQHGFISKKSTTTNLLFCVNDWTDMFDNKNNLDIIYLYITCRYYIFGYNMSILYIWI